MNEPQPHSKTADFRREAQQDLRDESLVSEELLESRTSEEARLILQKLRVNEAFQRDILNSLPAQVAVLGKTGIILAVNEPWLRFGRENGNRDVRKINVGVNYLDACRPACREGDVYAKAAADGIEAVLSGMLSRFSLEYPCDAPELARWFVMEVIPLAGNDGGAIVAHTCITERKQAEEKILLLNAELEQRVEKRTAELQEANTCLTDFKAALDEHALVAITDIDGTITYANDKFCEISKYSREELLGRNHRIVNSGHHPQEFFQGMWHTILSGRIWRGEVKNRAKDGSFYWLNSTIVPFLGLDGKPVQFIAIRTDITTRKLADERIRTLNATLESRAAALEEANLELESFSYSVSHDLRAPLRALNGFSRMLIEDCAAQLNDEGRRMLGVIHNEAQRMGRLIDDLLAFSRLGRQAIESTRVQMETMASEVFNELAALQPERHFYFNLHTLPPTQGSEPLIRQVWINLISNAIKFTNGREVGEIEIGAHESGEAPQSIMSKTMAQALTCGIPTSFSEFSSACIIRMSSLVRAWDWRSSSAS